MSQLSSGKGTRKTRNKQSNTAKQTLCFLIIFAIICSLITVGAIVGTLSLRNSEKTVVSKTIDDTKKVALYSKYSTNGISVKDVREFDGEIKEVFDQGDPIYEYEINYQEISGLKNTDLQNKINQDIKDVATKFKSKLKENPEYDRIAISAYVVGNFSDVLSVCVDYSLIQSYGDYNMETQSTGLNYRLDNGQKLCFNDMFLKTASIKKILSTSAYESYAREHAYTQEADFSLDLDDTDYGYIENKVFRTVAEYNRDNDIDFYFSPESIYAIINNFRIEIKMEDYSDDIAVYTKYLGDNLYTGEQEQKNFYPFTNSYIVDCFEVENTRGNNFYYEVITYEVDKEVNKEVAQKARETIDKKLAYYYEIATQNPDKAYMVSIFYYYDTREENPEKYYQYDGYVSEMDFDYYKENKDKIIATTRKTSIGELWSYDFSMFDENVEFYEEFSAYVDSYELEDYQEDILTREEKEARENELGNS